MRPPRFWLTSPDKPALRARLLAPLAALTARATARRVARAPDVTADVPVICIGNINAGGTGKTPTTIWLAIPIEAKPTSVACMPDMSVKGRMPRLVATVLTTLSLRALQVHEETNLSLPVG